MREGFNGVTLLAGAVMLSAGAYAQNKEAPVGLILSAEDAGIVHKNRPEISVNATGGDLLFPRDVIRTRNGVVTFILCPAGKIPTRQSLTAGSEVIIERDRVVDSAKKLKDRAELPFCRLPEVDPEPEISSKGVEDLDARVADPAAYTERVAGLPDQVRRELATIEAALRANPNDMVAMTSRAALLERNGLAAEAADQYATVAGTWKNQQWAKMLVQGNRRAAAPPRRSAGTTYAVVIGISRYDSPDINDLHFAHRDALQFAEYLSSKRGHEVPKDHIKLLIDGAATLPRIQESIRFLTEKAAKNDTVVFFISGHGDVSEGEGYLIPNHCDPKNLKDSAFPMASLFALMYEMSAKVGRFVVFVDACRAGVIGQITEKNTINQRIAGAIKNSAENLMALLASQKTELAWEHENFGEGHSAFSYFLLRGVAAEGIREADLNGDGKVSLSELIRYVQNQVPEATHDKQHPANFVRIEDWSEEELADIGTPGIKISGWKPMPKTVVASKAVNQEASPAYVLDDAAVPVGEEDLERLIRLEEQGQQIMLQYLKGDEIPQNRDDFERGRQLYGQALALAPGSLYLESRREFFHGRMLIFDKRYDDAIAHLETAIRLNPRSPSPYNALGIANLELGRYNEAVAAFESAISRAWYWPYPRHNLALAQMQMGRYEPAIVAYRKAMQLAPEYSYLPYNLGLIFQKMNRRREAEDAYLEAKRLADLRVGQSKSQQLAETYAERRATPLIALALLKANDGRYAQAAADYHSALTMLAPYTGNKNVLIARHDLALLLAKKKENWSEAEALLTKNIGAGYVPSEQRMAEWLVERGQPKEAVPHFETLLAAKPEYTAARLELAEQLEKLGESEREREQLDAARRYDPENVKVLLALARFESAQKRWDAARDAYRAALPHASDPKLRRQINTALKRLP